MAHVRVPPHCFGPDSVHTFTVGATKSLNQARCVLSKHTNPKSAQRNAAVQALTQAANRLVLAMKPQGAGGGGGAKEE